MKQHAMAIVTSSFFLGGLLFLWMNEWIIIQRPQHYQKETQEIAHKKKVTLYYWKNNAWHKELEEIVWPKHQTSAMKQLINCWLSMLDESDVLPKHVTVKTVTESPDQSVLYVSFDRNPVQKKWSIHQKWMLIEGLLKTVHPYTNHRSLMLLVRHQPLEDRHLDFSHPWLIHGFIEDQLQ